MKYLLFFLSTLLFLSCSKEPHQFGTPFTIGAEQTKHVTEALLPANFDRLIRLEGECYRVCQTEGCWLIVTDGKSKLRVTIKGKDFAAPLNLGSKKIVLEGTVSELLTSEADAREYADEAGKSEAETNAIQGDQRIPIFVATSLEIK